ncbi:MAG: ZIP family metal transporter [Gammaproteobacteria bacterium]|nr:ZIP family metal transporter [Gammaproteobacteria bacterium]
MVTYQQLLYIKLIAAVLVFVSILLNMIFFERIKWLLQKTDCVTTFSSGIFLGAALIHLLVDSVNGFIASELWLPLPFIIVGAVFILLTTTEQLVSRKKGQHQDNHTIIALYLWVVLTIHSFFVGLAVGGIDSLSILIIMVIVILLHKWPISLYFYEKIQISTLNRVTGNSLYFLFALMFPLGIFIAHSISHFIDIHAVVEPTFDAIAAGTFLFLGTLEGLEDATLIKRCTNIRHLSLLGCGFVFMVILAIF